MRPLSFSEVQQAFDAVDRDLVTVPDLSAVPWDDLDFLSWRQDSAGILGLVYPLPDRAYGLVLHQRSHAGYPNVGMCDLCFSIDRLSGTALVMVESWARPRTKIGMHVCRDLECSAAVRGLRPVYRMGETIPVGRRIERLQENVARFVRSVTR